MYPLRIALFVMGGFLLTVEAVNLGLCKDCKCVSSACDWPKTADECQACANSVSKSRISMEDGYCWVLVDPATEGNCALRTYSKLLGCSGFDGYTHYGGGNKNCWARWRPQNGRRRREVLNFMEGSSQNTTEHDLDSLNSLLQTNIL